MPQKGWEHQRLQEVSKALGRKCYLLDSAKLAHDVEVIVYTPEGTEHDGTLYLDTRTSVFVKGETQARMTSIVDQRTEKIQDILDRHR
jgi:hypothetical protein